jgi:hypothetical protein
MPRQRRIAPLAPVQSAHRQERMLHHDERPPMSLRQRLNRPLLCRGSRSAFAGGPTWRPAARAFMAHAEIVANQRCHRIGTTNAFATSVVMNATSGTSTAVLRAPTGRIVDTSCRASRNASVARPGRREPGVALLRPGHRQIRLRARPPRPAPCRTTCLAHSSHHRSPVSSSNGRK